MTITTSPHPTGNTPGRPTTSPPRWRPARAGVLNIWRYYDEVFTFHRGRLLLRGPNGTGKSKALEVLLPFLFDASLRPNRLSTFGGSERTMHWNLMGEGTSGVTRVGYVWLEFSTAHTDGTAWYTIGARLQATTRTTSVTADYFTLRGRVATPGGVALVNDAGQPLTRAALSEALTGHGELHDSAGDYRAAVRQTLFPGLSEQRYDALITALLQLRTPKLSERLDPSLLSTLLSRALPPLDRGEITELADGFERLDRRRENLATLDQQVHVAETLAARQRAYAQRVLRAGAGRLISATTDMDNRTRTARESEEEHAKAVAEQTETAERQAAAEALAGELRSRIEALTESESYQQGRELGRLRQRAADARTRAHALRLRADTAHQDTDRDTRRAQEADSTLDHHRTLVHDAETATRTTARTAGLAAVHNEITTALAADDPERARRLLHGAVRARLDVITEVRTAVTTHHDAIRTRTQAEATLEEARAALSAATTHRTERATAYQTAVTEHAERLRAWALDCTELVFTPEALDRLADSAASETDVLALTEAAAREIEHALTAEETVTGRHIADLTAERHRLTTEAARLRDTPDPLPPPPPHTRTTDRGALPGAPLWQLITFSDGVPAGERAAIEAALEASGLLDAWIPPHGPLTIAGHDTFAEPQPGLGAGPGFEPGSGTGLEPHSTPGSRTGPGTGVTPETARSLADVLRPEPDGPVPAERIHHLLAGIAYGPTPPAGHPSAIGADGTWRLATLTGSWGKPAAEHIGAPARAHARRQRLTELTTRIGELDTALTAWHTTLATLAGRRHTLERDRGNRPAHTPLTTAKRHLDRAESQVAAHDDTVRTAVTRLTERETAVTAALRALDATAAERALPTTLEALDALTTGAETLRDTAGQWLFAHLRLTAEHRTVAEVRAQAERSASAAAEHEREAVDAETTARNLAGTLDEVEATVGAAYEDVLTRMETLRADLRSTQDTMRHNQRTLLDLAGKIGALDTLRTTTARGRDDAIAARDTAAARFRHHLTLGFAADATTGPPDPRLGTPDGTGAPDNGNAPKGTRATLEAARLIATLWPTLPHAPKNLADALGRLTEAVHTSRQTLSERADLNLEPDDDVHILTAAMDGATIGATRLLTSLTAERDRSRADITAAERDLFDKTLTGDTRRHIAARIRQANELVDAMNARLERVRTASRVAVRLVWQVAPGLPTGTKTARELLLKDPVRLTEADREALHRFFRDRIEEAKAAQTAATWEEQLAQVLDYTAWHQFVVKLDRANGQGWQLLTKKLHGALSGGEKAIALHLPLFAAVAAHYHAVPEAPRLILLDEVFVGVDSTNRGQVFGLLSALDLDLMLTSDHEWCTYRELDGIAIHQLITGGTRPDDDAVTTARFVWDGADLTADGTPP